VIANHLSHRTSTSPRPRRRWCGLTLVTATMILASACGVPSDDAPVAIVLSEEVPVVASDNTAVPGQTLEEVTVYLVKSETDEQREVLAKVARHAGDASPKAVLETLFAATPIQNLSAEENLRNAIPEGVTFDDVNVRTGPSDDGDTPARTAAIIDLNEETAARLNDNELRLIAAQIVLTLTALEEPKIDQVLFRVDGEIGEVPDDDGVTIQVATRDAYASIDPDSRQNRDN